MVSSSDSVEFVDDLKHGIAGILEQARERIVIVCPYVRLDDVGQLATRLISALEGGVEVTLIVRDERRQRDEALGAFRDTLRRHGLNFLAVKNLHAKVYMSEASTIVSSVNLLETSFQHGLEVGLRVPRGALYERLVAFIELKLLDAADVILGASRTSDDRQRAESGRQVRRLAPSMLRRWNPREGLAHCEALQQ